MTYRALCIGGCVDGEWHESEEHTAVFHALPDLSFTPCIQDTPLTDTIQTDVYRIERISFGRDHSPNIYVWLGPGMTMRDALMRLCEHYRPPATTRRQAEGRVDEAIRQYDELAGNRSARPDADEFYMPQDDVDLLDEDHTIDEAMDALRQIRKGKET